MRSHRTDRQLRLELLRARAAANRIDLALAVQDISERFAPIRRTVDSIGSVAGALGGRARAVRWAVAAGAAWARGRWLLRTVSGLVAGLRPKGRFRGRLAALSLIGLLGVALLVRRPRRSTDAKGR
jgi:hypothetical protein